MAEGGSQTTLSMARAMRYRRNALLPEVGEEGQERLLDSRVLVIGAGGLGSAAALYLAAAGIGVLGILDGDRVELSNLQRQILHRTTDVGQSKVESAVRTLVGLNPTIQVLPYEVVLDEVNALDIVSGFDVVVDGVDNLPTRYLVNEACVRGRIPLIEAGVVGTGGLVTTIMPGVGPCYRCLFPTPPRLEEMPDCPRFGVLGTVAGLAGVLEANEAIKVLLGRGETLVGRLLFIDLWTNEFRTISAVRAEKCPVCGGI